MRTLKLTVLAALAATAVAGCTVQDVDTPPLAGPSSLARTIVITADRDTLLQDGLQEVGPQLTGAGPDQDWWSALKNELGTLVTVRKSDSPSTMPAERLRRATRRLEAGQVDVALAEVLRMPGRENAQEWIAAARRAPT